MTYTPPPARPLSIVYCDDKLLAVSKPAGLLSVPGRTPEKKDCLESRVQERFESARIAHRLDMETSGIMLFALDPGTLKHCSWQFEQRKTKKSYIARIAGLIEQDSGEINLPLRCDWPNRPKQMVDHEQGKHAQTFWEVIDREENATRVRLTPITGRSHQLRVHMLSIGHPILGDDLYAPPQHKQGRLQLHAEKLEICHPDKDQIIKLYDPCPF